MEYTSNFADNFMGSKIATSMHLLEYVIWSLLLLCCHELVFAAFSVATTPLTHCIIVPKKQPNRQNYVFLKPCSMLNWGWDELNRQDWGLA